MFASELSPECVGARLLEISDVMIFFKRIYSVGDLRGDHKSTVVKHEPSVLISACNMQVVANFKTRAQCISDLFSSYEFWGGHVNGKLTLGESIADK